MSYELSIAIILLLGILHPIEFIGLVRRIILTVLSIIDLMGGRIIHLKPIVLMCAVRANFSIEYSY